MKEEKKREERKEKREEKQEKKKKQSVLSKGSENIERGINEEDGTKGEDVEGVVGVFE
jgi:hypothetical protein